MRIRDLILNNFWWKFISLVLASMIWFTIFAMQRNLRIGQPDPANAMVRTFVKHPITVMRTAADVRSFRVVPSEVDVTVSGPAAIVQSLTDREVEVYINLTDVLDAEGLIKKVQIFTPQSVNVIEVRPPDVRIERVRP